ncbi:NAD(FAD)-dependent dehydrogenase [Nostoc sp. PCC 7524]|uniref:NAD(P)/FAD-dependent oxidoreductase n=1 Tax=Nostoc sp. (strain ATCC 29411 / PCC 7524) TaxID=28072 RepID=UPI00029F15B6|nr:FAD/NAD(P)-binding oxidoreductase [Nostoc sp. PCC 7524]AFY47008.1 NAD(FAD)-dependent dehydrogenase [Nostoc sp. PCC 7524]
MAHIVIVGAGLGGLPTAYELRHILPRQHQVTVISESPNFTFIPSLPWVALGLTSLDSIQMSLEHRLKQRNINWIHGRVDKLNPHSQEIFCGEQTIAYDYLIIATGAELALDALSGLGPEGYTQSVCNPHHALMAGKAWQEFLLAPGPIVVGALPKTSCLGPAYEFAMLTDYVLRQKGLREQVSITFVTPEPYAGHLGIGGMANSAQLVKKMMAERDVEIIENAAVTAIEPNQIHLGNGRVLPFAYSMLLPPFRGPRFVRQVPGLSNPDGFIPVLPTYRHPEYPSIYAVGVVVQIKLPEETPLPLGVPKTGQMTEAMGMAVAHNIAIELGVISAQPVTPTLDAICFADFGKTGILFLANPVLPDLITGKRRRAVALSGTWVSWAKTAFEKYFLAKMRFGAAVPWFERIGLKFLGLSLVEPIPVQSSRNISQEIF